MSVAYEVRVNIALARLLGRLGFREIAERIVKGQRLDIILFHKGLRIAFEGSYDSLDAQKDAEERLESGLADLCFAVWYDKDLFPQYLDEAELERRLERAKLKVKIMAPGEDVTNTLLPFLMKVTKLPAEPLVEGWLIVDVPLLKQCVEYAVQHAASERKIQQLQVEVGSFVQDFTNALKSIDREATICKELYDTFYKLYGLSVGDYMEIRDLIYGKTALAILLSSVFYECVAGKHGLRSLRALIWSEGSARSALTTSFKKIWKINYQPVFSVAYESLSKLPAETETMLKNLIELASKIADNRALLRRDFAGKIYHAIVGDWVVRKGFATYFTSVPAAYMLSSLALLTPNSDWREKEWSDLDWLKTFRICDFAEGTGTLLSSACDALEYLYIKDALSRGREIDIENFHRTVVEDVIWGYDALRYAVHIAATTLALRNPDVTLSDMNLYAVPLGINSEGRVSLGSLEFLGKGVPTTILGYLGEKKGAIVTKISTAEEVEVSPIPQKFDYITMNPPFTRQLVEEQNVNKREEDYLAS